MWWVTGRGEGMEVTRWRLWRGDEGGREGEGKEGRGAREVGRL